MMRETHPYLTRLSHWLLAIAVFVLGASGLEIFQAFPSFGSKLPKSLEIPVPSWMGMGGWLGGALSWHFAFAWLFGMAMALYTIDLMRGGWRRLWLKPEEWKGIWPMARHYFLRGPKPPLHDLYNPLQKAAYLSVTVTAFGSLITGVILAQPVQLGFVAGSLVGWQVVRLMHFLCLCSFAAFVPGHLLMVMLAGRSAIWAMLSGLSVDHQMSSSAGAPASHPINLAAEP